MKYITTEQLKAICPRINDVDQVVTAMNGFFSPYGIVTYERICAFVAQMAHESNEFNSRVENLDYSAERLRQVWPRKFPSKGQAALYAHSPERLANYVYADRLGNGDEASGDGWRFRGRGWIQLTGRANYQAFCADTNLDVLLSPDLLSTHSAAAMAACWFWQRNKCNAFADLGDFESLTKRINGGLNGLPDRIKYWHKAQMVMRGEI